MNEETMNETTGEKKPSLVGIRYNDNAIVAWNLAENKNIQVTAHKVAEREWHILGCAAGTPRIAATVFGGKNATMKFARFIRNGLTSRVMRRKPRSAPATPPSSAKATEGKLTANC